MFWKCTVNEQITLRTAISNTEILKVWFCWCIYHLLNRTIKLGRKKRCKEIKSKKKTKNKERHFPEGAEAMKSHCHDQYPKIRGMILLETICYLLSRTITMLKNMCRNKRKWQKSKKNDYLGGAEGIKSHSELP